MMRTVFIPALVVAVSVLVAIALMATSPVLSPASLEAVLPTIRTQTAQAEQVRLVVNSQGSIVPRTESDLVPEVSGRVVWMSPALISGGYFQEGETLLELDKADYQVSLKRASANLKRAQAEQEHAYFEYERLKSLEARQLVSISQLENALRVSRITAATLEEAQVSHDQANLDLSRTTMVAPYAGFVRSKSVDVGQFVGRGSKVARVFSSDSIEVRLPIADKQLAYLGLSSTSNRGRLPDELQLDVELSADYAGLNLSWQGKIVRFEAEIDAKSRMLNAVARVTSRGPQDMLTVGMFVHAEIKGVVKQDIYVLPRTALRDNNEVLLVNKDGRLTARPIEVLRVFQNKVYISAGLQDGDEVNISSINTFIDGMYVKAILAGELPGA